jgi:mannose-6-phosphate isomerase-like protein (cupin superfamily)
MAYALPQPQSIDATIDGLTFLPDRTPTSGAEAATAFARLADYRDGAVFVGHWAGTSEWERHPVGDEVVMVVDGETTLVLVVDGVERPQTMSRGDLIVVPRGTWHRFETPEAVKVLTVSPQPTDHLSDTSTVPPES